MIPDTRYIFELICSEELVKTQNAMPYVQNQIDRSSDAWSELLKLDYIVQHNEWNHPQINI